MVGAFGSGFLTRLYVFGPQRAPASALRRRLVFRILICAHGRRFLSPHDDRPIVPIFKALYLDWPGPIMVTLAGNKQLRRDPASSYRVAQVRLPITKRRPLAADMPPVLDAKDSGCPPPFGEQF